MSKIFIISSVRNASDETRKTIEEHVRVLEEAGNEVHLPHRDTNQDATGIEICRQNAQAIADADVVHIFYDPDSKGSHFDLGVAWGLNKHLLVIENVEYGEGKSYPRMIEEWQSESRRVS
jgi:nucleoside 2-deoxyribosyltransferase